MKNLKKTRSSLFLGAAALGALALAGVALAHPKDGGRSRGGGLSLERLDTNADGVVSLTEMQTHAAERLAHKLQRLDADGNGIVTPEEREAFAAEREAHGHPRRRAPRPSLDDEAATVVEMEAKLSSRVARRFAKMDTNADGHLDAAELEAAKAQRRARWEAGKARRTP